MAVLSFWVRILVTFLLLAVVVAGCAGERPTVTDVDLPPNYLPVTSVAVTAPAPVQISTAGSNDSVDLAIVATAVNDTIEVFNQPSEADPQRTITKPERSNSLVLLVDQTVTAVDGWHHVLLPIRPNGSTGWVRAADVSTARHNYRIDVSLSDFELRVFDGGQLQFQATIAVAADNSPTPGGQYYITELLQPLEPDTVYGSFAYGLSGFSETFETFNGGPGQLGIHGTNDPDAIGSQASAGCVRLANGDIAHLVEFLPLGTPVQILA